jgi:spore photoproduct lyase
MDNGKKSGSKPDDEERLEDHEAELAAQEAEVELHEDMNRISEREYQKMAADLRWEALEYVDAHPDKSVIEVAELFGLKEGTIRAWKAHRTMGTYRRGAEAPSIDSEPVTKKKQRHLFRERKEPKPASFIERKRYSNFIHFFNKTPPGIVCPHFHILAHANGCPFYCDYCYLRLTLRHYPEPTVFSNTARLFQELRDWLLSQEEPGVLNSGELSDSLAWDGETALSTNLVPLFETQKRHKLLLLTKSTAVDNILKMDPTPQVIVSFSVNAEAVSGKYELKAPSPGERLAAAGKLKEAGWEVRIRIDPMIPIEGWKDHYGDIIDGINGIEPSVVTLGSLRYFKNLLAHAPKESDVFKYGHDHHDPDGRLRVREELRIEMYRFCLDRLTCLRVGLCKETEKMHHTLGLPGTNQSCNCTIE